MAGKKDFNPFLALKVEGVHNDCWTTKIDFPTQIIHYHDMGPYVKMSVIVPKKDLKKFVSALREYYRLFSIQTVQEYSRDRVLLSVIKNYRQSSLFKAIDGVGGIFFSSKSEGGVENWEFAVPTNRKEDVLEVMGETLDIRNVRERNFVVPNMLELSRNEMRVLKAAMELGYFDFPRRTNSSELSKFLGIDRTTLIYHIRSIQKKLGMYILNAMGEE
jgi:Predicted DNA binding protein